MKTRDLPFKEFDLHENGTPIMKLGLGMRLFFPRPFHKVRTSLKTLWDRYLEWVGKGTFTWARLGGGNRSRKVSESVFKTIDAWLTGKSDPGRTCWISISDGRMDDLGQNSFFLEGHERDGEDVNFVELAVPVTLLDSVPADRLAEHFIDLAADVPFFSGVAGYWFHHSPYKQEACASSMATLSRRFKGVEVTFSDRMQFWAGKGLTTVNWITFVGNPFLKKLGGSGSLSDKLPKECVVRTVRGGVAIRCGPEPALGDTKAKRDELALWRKLYTVVKPVQFVDREYRFSLLHFNGDKTVEWLTRLDS